VAQGVKFYVRSKVKRIDLSEYQGATGDDEQRLEDRINGMCNPFSRETLVMLNLSVARPEESEEDAPAAAPDDQLVQKIRTHFLDVSAEQWLEVTLKVWRHCPVHHCYVLIVSHMCCSSRPSCYVITEHSKWFRCVSTCLRQ
jgi:hypothetical protein